MLNFKKLFNNYRFEITRIQRFGALRWWGVLAPKFINIPKLWLSTNANKMYWTPTIAKPLLYEAIIYHFYYHTFIHIAISFFQSLSSYFQLSISTFQYSVSCFRYWISYFQLIVTTFQFVNSIFQLVISTFQSITS